MKKILSNGIIKNLKGTISVPGDKSISHRAIMLGSIAEGDTEIENFLMSDDCVSTINCFKKMGISIIETSNKVIVRGKGLDGLEPSATALDAGNSGTTTRLMSGILAGQSFQSTITGDTSLVKRPMGRIMSPLCRMGAKFVELGSEKRLPFKILGGQLRGCTIKTPVASAQVKSACLFAGLYANKPTTVIEPSISRNHSERMLEQFGANITVDGNKTTIEPRPTLKGQKIIVPNDISSAAYFMVAGLITEGSDITIENVNVNPTRNGIIRVIQAMNGDITLENERIVSNEEVCDVHVKYSPEMRGITIDRDLIPTLIDELPVIAVLATQAEGKTIIADAAELKVKECNRIEAMVNGLEAMGAFIEARPDGMIIYGKTPLNPASIVTYDDHRIAMSFAIANLICEGSVVLDNGDCVSISFPEFYDTLLSL